MPEWLGELVSFILGLFARNHDLEERVDNLKERINQDAKAVAEEDPMAALRREFPRE
jgi:hypothetical protein